MPWFQAVRPQQVGTVLLLDELAACRLDEGREDKLLKPTPRLHLRNEVAAALGPLDLRPLQPVRAVGHVTHRLGQPVGDHVVLLRSLFGDDRLDGRPRQPPVANGDGLHEAYKKITTGHTSDSRVGHMPSGSGSPSFLSHDIRGTTKSKASHPGRRAIGGVSLHTEVRLVQPKRAGCHEPPTHGSLHFAEMTQKMSSEEIIALVWRVPHDWQQA